jgi:hypothetical protein
MGYCSTYYLQILEYQGQNRVITEESGVSTITVQVKDYFPPSA